MKSADQKNNEFILKYVEKIGGGYVWEDEIFVVELHDVAVTDEQTEPLLSLVGVQQIALNASALSHDALIRLAKIRGLESLVLIEPKLNEAEIEKLGGFGPEVEVAEL